MPILNLISFALLVAAQDDEIKPVACDVRWEQNETTFDYDRVWFDCPISVPEGPALQAYADRVAAQIQTPYPFPSGLPAHEVSFFWTTEGWALLEPLLLHQAFPDLRGRVPYDARCDYTVQLSPEGKAEDYTLLCQGFRRNGRARRSGEIQRAVGQLLKDNHWIIPPGQAEVCVEGERIFRVDPRSRGPEVQEPWLANPLPDAPRCPGVEPPTPIAFTPAQRAEATARAVAEAQSRRARCETIWNVDPDTPNRVTSLALACPADAVQADALRAYADRILAVWSMPAEIAFDEGARLADHVDFTRWSTGWDLEGPLPFISTDLTALNRLLAPGQQGRCLYAGTLESGGRWDRLDVGCQSYDIATGEVQHSEALQAQLTATLRHWRWLLDPDTVGTCVQRPLELAGEGDAQAAWFETVQDGAPNCLDFFFPR